MRYRFFTAPIAVAAAVVLLGATVGGLVLANQASSPPTEPAPTATPEPEPTVVSVEPASDPDLGAGLAPFELAGRFLRRWWMRSRWWGRRPGSRLCRSRSRCRARSGRRWRLRRGASRGRVFTWQDGDRTLTAVLQEDLAVLDRSAVKSDDVGGGRGRRLEHRRGARRAGVCRAGVPVVGRRTDDAAGRGAAGAGRGLG